jgi:hypothetical protein
MESYRIPPCTPPRPAAVNAQRGRHSKIPVAPITPLPVARFDLSGAPPPAPAGKEKGTASDAYAELEGNDDFVDASGEMFKRRSQSHSEIRMHVQRKLPMLFGCAWHQESDATGTCTLRFDLDDLPCPAFALTL